MKKNVLTAVAAVAGLVVGGAGVAIAVKARAPQTAIKNYISGRYAILEEQAEKVPPGGVLILGDSIVERAFLPTLCGRPTFNGGVSSVKVHDVLRGGVELISEVHPSAVILAVGVNDAKRHAETPTSRFRDDYDSFLIMAGSHVGVVQIMPVQYGRAAGRQMNDGAIKEFNNVIAAEARAHGAVVVAPLVTLDTHDGVHPTPAGAAAWKADVEQACSSLLPGSHS